MPTLVLGISCFYHDAAAALVRDGRIVAAAQEERFTRVKHDPRFPRHAVNYVLEEAFAHERDLDLVVFYDKPLLTFDRLVESYRAVAPEGRDSFRLAVPPWLSTKLDAEQALRDGLPGYTGRVLFTEHHEAHAASAFFPSPFESAAVLTMDGVGEWATASFGEGEGARLSLRGELRFPHSLGLLYSAFTQFCGFKINSGEYKLMGLAPYGTPRYAGILRDKLVDVREDGSLRLDMDYFAYLGGDATTNERFADLFGGPARAPESRITRREMDLAASIQVVTEEVVLKMGRHVRRETGRRHLCLAGGVALNCVANGKLLRAGIFDDLWIQPAAGDAGGSVGAALSGWHSYLGRPRPDPAGSDGMQGAYLGPAYSTSEVRAFLDAFDYPYETLPEDARATRIAGLLAEGRIVGYFAGRMEFGPRSLGARSILGDPRRADTQTTMNLKIKFRESFRPFAPAVLAERTGDYFDLAGPSPYMLLVAPVREERQLPFTDVGSDDLMERLRPPRSDLPAVTHLDYSARVQTVHRETNPGFHDVLAAFERLTGCAVLVNTSFNVRGEPIVCSPVDAYRCFMRTHMDALVLEDALLVREAQPPWIEKGDWRREFALD
jgi:carbamoyltransferase